MSKNNAKMVQQKMADQKQKFGIRKLSVGVASVLLGTVFYMQSGTVHADVNPTTSAGNDNANVISGNSITSGSAVTLSASNSADSASSANEMASSMAASQASASPAESVTSQTNNNMASAVSEQASATPVSQVNMGTDKAVTSGNTNVVSSSAPVQNNQTSASTGNTTVASNTSDDSTKNTTPWYTEQEKLDIAKENIVDHPAEGSELEKNGGLDPSVWGTFNINDWDVAPITVKRSSDGELLKGVTLTGYHGDKDHIILPDSSAVEDAHPELFSDHNVSGNVYVSSDFIHKLIMDNNPITFAVRDGSSLLNSNSDWSWTFARTNDKKTLLGDSRLTKVNLMRLSLGIDVGISSLDHMFDGDHLDSIANIDFSSIQPSVDSNGKQLPITTRAMFKGNNLKQLDGYVLNDDGTVNNQPGTGNTSLGYFFSGGYLSDVSEMFANNQLYTLDNNDSLMDSIAGYDGKGIVADRMFANNHLTDLSNVGFLSNVNLSSGIGMFENNNISKLPDQLYFGDNQTTPTPDLSYMFANNQLTELPQVDWVISPSDQIKKLNLTGMFANNKIADVSKAADWSEMTQPEIVHFGEVNLAGFLENNQVSDLKGFRDWNTSTVTDMSSLFKHNKIVNTDPISKWDTSLLTDAHNMFCDNQITDPALFWNKTSNLTNTSGMFAYNNLTDSMVGLATFNTFNVMDMHDMFKHNKLSSVVDFSLNTSKVTDMSGMFSDNQLTKFDLVTSLDMASVIDMHDMFKNNQFKQIDTSDNSDSYWTSIDNLNAKDMSGVFDGNPITYADLNYWNLTNAEKLGNFVNADTNSIVIVKPADLAKMSGTSQTYDGQTLPVVNTKQNQLHFGSDTVDMPTVYVATDKADVRQKILADINTKLADYRAGHIDKIVTPTVPLDQLTELVDLANAKFTVENKSETASISYIDDTTGKTLTTETATGTFDSAIKFATDPTAKIADYVAKGYELVSNDFNNQKYVDGVNQFAVHLKHRIDIPTDTRANTVYEQIIHYQDNKGNKLADDTVIKADFHRNYSVDMVTNVPTWGPWFYVKGSLTQTGTHIDDLKDPGDRYNKVDGFDSFNFWIPFRTFENYHAQYSGLAASWSVANGDGYVGGPVSEETVVYELNKFVSDAVMHIKYKNLDDDFVDYQNGDLSKYPVSAIFVTDFDKLAMLPIADSNITLHFKHATYDVSTKMPVWQAPTVQLSDQGMKVLIDELNSQSNARPGNNLHNITSRAEFKKLLPQIFANAKWTSGGLLISGWVDNSDWNLFSTNSSGNLFAPMYERPENVIDIEPNKFYLNDNLKVLLKKAENDGHDWSAIMVGNMPMLTINAKGDAFNERISNVTTDAGSQTLTAKSIPEGYHANVLIPVVSKDGSSVTYKQVMINSKDLQDQISLVDHISKAYGESTLKTLTSEDGSSGRSGLNLNVEQSSDGQYDWALTKPYAIFDQLKGAAGLSAINESLLPDYYSKAYTEAINESLRQSKENYGDVTIQDLEALDQTTPLTMLYTLSADPQQVIIKYVDQSGKMVKSTVVNGHTGEQTNLTFTVPYNYFATSKLPAAGYTFTTDNKNIVIPVEEKQTATEDPTTSDKDALNLINYTDENGKVIKTDKVTGEIGDKVNVTVPDGYHFVDGKVLTVVITENPEQTVKIVKDQHETGDATTSDKDVLNLINYTNENGKVIKTDKVTGKIGDKANVTVPDGYHFVDDKVPTVIITNDPQQVVKIVKDQHETGDATTSEKDVLNLINYTDENGKVIKTDKVTGKIGDKVNVTIPDDYHFVDGKVPTVIITNDPQQVVKIVKDQHETGDATTSEKDVLNLINYTDENGKVIKTDKVTGKIGDKVTVNVPDGYHFVDGKVPTVVITENPEQTIKIVKDQHETGDPATSDKDILNLINYTDENGKVIKTDKVTGKFGDTIKVNIPDGYHFVDGKVPTVVITNDPEQTVKIVKDQHETGDPTTSDKDVLNLINYTDENGKVIKTDKVTGKFGDTIKVNIPDGYHFVDGKVPTVVITNDPEQTVKIVKDQHETGDPTTSDKDVLNLINYTDENGKVVKTDKVIGKIGDGIKLNIPAGYHLDKEQSALLTISDNPVQTVKIVKDQVAVVDQSTTNTTGTQVVNPVTTAVSYSKNSSAGKSGMSIAKPEVVTPKHVSISARRLPQTGNHRETGLIALGLVSGLLGLIGLKKKKQD